MNHKVTISFALLLFVTAATFGGMIVFGMEHGMSAGVLPCDHGECMPAGADPVSGALCVSHCLQSAAPAATVPATPAIATVLLVVFSFCVSLSRRVSPSVAHTFGFFGPARDGIEKLFLKQHLSTVVLRN